MNHAALITGPNEFKVDGSWACAVPCPVCAAPLVVTVDVCKRQRVWCAAHVQPLAEHAPGDATHRALTPLETHDITYLTMCLWYGSL